MKLRSLRLGWLVANFALFWISVGPVASAEKGKSGITVDWGKMKDGSQNSEGRYTAEGLRQAFAALCKSLRYRAQRVEIDQSESPFLIYGVLEGRCDYKDIRDQLGSMPGYAYSGCFTAVIGNESVTLFALNMTPSSEYAHDKESFQRMIDRMKKLALSQR